MAGQKFSENEKLQLLTLIITEDSYKMRVKTL
jgi:hypothetical protein